MPTYDENDRSEYIKDVARRAKESGRTEEEVLADDIGTEPAKPRGVGKEIIDGLTEAKEELEKKLVQKKVREESDKLKRRLNEKIVKGDFVYLFEPVYWDNCPLDKLLKDVKQAVEDGTIEEKVARPYIWKLTAGQRPAFPGWRK